MSSDRLREAREDLEYLIREERQCDEAIDVLVIAAQEDAFERAAVAARDFPGVYTGPDITHRLALVDAIRALTPRTRGDDV